MRLFLALIPPPGLRRQLGGLADAAHAQCGGRRIVDDNLHLTLAFLGEQPEEQGEALADWLRRQRLGKGHWRLDRWGYFPGPRIVWAGGPPADDLLQCRASLVASLQDMGFMVQPRAFRPHISLLRNAQPPADTAALPAMALDWSFSRVALVHSTLGRTGSQYTTLAESRPQEDG